MAARVKRHGSVARRAGAVVRERLAWAPALLALASHVAAAQALPDPTRPPEGVRAVASPGAAPEQLVLQSVVIAGARRSALINGQVVSVGTRLGGARVERIGEAEVELTRDGRRETLRLFPAVDKRAASLSDAQPARALP